MMVVADKFQLGRNGKKFSKQLRGDAERTSQVVTRDWAEAQNENHEVGGIWYEIDEEATAVYYDSKGKYKTVQAEVIEEVNPLHTEYEELFNKKPFHTWDDEKIQSKIDIELAK